jgi:glycosyltransferase involved in cell wall biosynthesis
MGKAKLIVGIPAKNEEKTIGKVIQNVKKYTKHIYVFDDGSTDKTREISLKNKAKVISNPCNLGKGSTLRHAIHYLMETDIFKRDDALIFIDADGQLDAKYITDFMEIVEDIDMTGFFDFFPILIVGNRDLSEYPISKKIGNWFLNKLSSLLSGIEIKDSESGYRLYNYEMALNLLRYGSSAKYGIEIEANIVCGKMGGKIFYIPVESSFIKGRGTKIKDGIINAISGMICWTKIMLER